MSLTESQSENGRVVEVNWGERWQVYQRLQELQIPCQCFTDRPLQVQIQNTKEAVQLWSVVRQIRLPRYELVNWLNHCWLLEIDTTEN